LFGMWGINSERERTCSFKVLRTGQGLLELGVDPPHWDVFLMGL